jgi:prophage regulatory protein
MKNDYFSFAASTQTSERVLALKDVIHITGLSKSTIYLYIQLEKFPPSIRIGFRRVGWVESEIRNWVREKIELGQATNYKRTNC